eukprot:5513613-Lingulodinium_polyedra.AAC.1
MGAWTTVGGPLDPNRPVAAKAGGPEGLLVEKLKAVGSASAKAGGPQKSDYVARARFPLSKTLKELKDLVGAAQGRDLA